MQDPSERREHRRLPYNREVKFAWLHDGCIAWPARRIIAEDISKGGIRLRGEIIPEGATSAVIELKRADGTRAVMGVNVVYTKNMIHTAAQLEREMDAASSGGGGSSGSAGGGVGVGGGLGGGVAGARFFALSDELIERELTDAQGRVTGLDAYVAA